MSNQRLANKKAIVTGAGTGIGREIALEFARQGAAVAFHYSHSADGAESAVQEARVGGARVEAFQADFADLAAVRRFGAAAVTFLGGLDILVNNAGITFNKAFEDVTAEQFDVLYQVNVRAPFFLTQALVPDLAQSKGVVLSLSSVHGLLGMSGHSVYAGTKGAIIAYTRELAVELSQKGIRLNTIVPGAVPVENQRKIMTIDPAEIGKGIPCGFPGTPADIAKFAVFLASDDARYILGQTLVIDGGTTSWLSFDQGFKTHFDAPFGRGYVPGV
jgi:NAD(P)-dependent dehydrogenase (short-subunit alcohol dehydrogenase family)